MLKLESINIPPTLILISIFMLGLGAIGCSTKSTPVAALEAQRGPANMLVLSERRIEDTLALTVELEPVVVWPSNGIAVELTLLKDGEEIASRSVSPSSVDGLLRPGTPVQIPLTLAGAGMTDYRLDLKWGAQLGPATDRSGLARASNATSDDSLADGSSDALSKERREAQQVQGEVLLTEQTLAIVEQDCAVSPCPISFRYAAQLQNHTDKVVTSVILMAHFKDSHGEQGEPSTLEVNGLSIGPGEQRPLRVTFDAPEISPAVQRSLTPELEIKSFK